MMTDIDRAFRNYEPFSKIVIVSLVLMIVFAAVGLNIRAIPALSIATSSPFLMIILFMFLVYVLLMIKTPAKDNSASIETAEPYYSDTLESPVETYDKPYKETEDNRMIVLFSFVTAMFFIVMIYIISFVDVAFVVNVFGIFAFFVLSMCTMIIGLEMFRSVRDFGRP